MAIIETTADIFRPTQAQIYKNQYTTPGIEVGAGEITASDFDSLDYTTQMQDYTDMRNGDPIVSTATEILKLPILQAPYEITGPNQEANEYIQWCLDSLYDGFEKFKYHALLCLDYGHIMFEKVYQNGVDYNGTPTNIISRMSPIQFHTIYRFYYNDTMDFEKIQHWRIGKDNFRQLVDIEGTKLFWFSHNEEFNDIRGRSIYRTVRKLFRYKQQVLDSTALATSRGAGLPVIQVQSNADSATIERANVVGRTVANTRNAYVIEEKDKLSFRLESLQGQENNMPLLQWIDSQMFMNTMTQFIVSGIGANGSRAATSEHKGSYELMANSILYYIEKRMNDLLDEMISISYLANMPYAERPRIEFQSVNQIDLVKAEAQIRGLIQSGAIQPNEDDEAFIRKMFGLPEKSAIQATMPVADANAEQVAPTADGQTEPQAAALCSCSDHVKLTAKKPRELTRVELEVFELESARRHFIETKEKAERTLDDFKGKVLRDFVEQLKGNIQRPLNIRYVSECVKKLGRIYAEGYNRGRVDVKKELAKVKKASAELTVQLDLASEAKAEPVQYAQKRMDRLVNNYFNTLKKAVETEMQKKYIQRIIDTYYNGDYAALVMSFESTAKGEASAITKFTESSYIDGRGTELAALPDDTEYQYSAVLDDNICMECEPEDGVVYKKSEIKDQLQLEHPINMSCQGGDRCRCVWIVNG